MQTFSTEADVRQFKTLKACLLIAFNCC